VDRAVSGPLEAIRGGLVVSCQAPLGSPLARTDHLVAMARAAEAGGASGIRAESADFVGAIKDAVALPLIGLRKRRTPDSEVYITPELDGFLDALAGELALPVLADVDSVEAGAAARAGGAAAVATTLSGYTGGGPVPPDPDLDLVASLVAELDCPVLAEGRYATPDAVRAALDEGAFAVVVGAAITDPVALTRRFVAALDRSADVAR
jgi:N-acylglucosamine-6-phosphate 2-epimerase